MVKNFQKKYWLSPYFFSQLWVQKLDQRNDDVRKRAKKPKSLARNSSFFTHYKLVWLGFLKLSPGAQSCRLEVEKKTKGSWASSLDLLT